MNIVNRHQIALCLSSLFLMSFCMLANATWWYEDNGDFKLCEDGVFKSGVTNKPYILAKSSCSDYHQSEELTVTVNNTLSYPIQFNCQALANDVFKGSYDAKNTSYMKSPSCTFNGKNSPSGLIKPGSTATLTLSSGDLMPFVNQYGMTALTNEVDGLQPNAKFNNNSSQILLSIAAGDKTWRFPFTFNEYALSNEEDCYVNPFLGKKGCDYHQKYHMSVFQMLNYSLSKSYLANTNWWGTNCGPNNNNPSCIFLKATNAIQSAQYMTSIQEDNSSDQPVVTWNASGLVRHGVSTADKGFLGVVFYGNNESDTYGTISLTITKGASS